MNFTSPCPTTPIFATLINTLLTSQCLLSPVDLFPSDYGPKLQDGDQFDFIVVGGGTAGSVVASRLSENRNWKVLLLEAGGYPSAESEIPMMCVAAVKGAEDWGYDSEPSPGVENRTMCCPRGKALGGSGAINGMIYLHGNREDFDSWEEEGWDYDSVVEYYRRFEDLRGVEDERFGKGGELKVIWEKSLQPLRQVLIDSFEELGFGKFTEENGIGHTYAYNNIWEGRRFSTAKAFLSTAEPRKNLHLALHSHVEKLLVDESLKVTGVKVRINGKLLKITSKGEVVLSAGAVNSPQILMNSGIGPREHLERVGIRAVKNLKVGRNLQDHLAFTGLAYNVAESALLPKNRGDVIDELYQYFMHRSGPLSKSPAESLILFANTKRQPNRPSLEVYHIIIYKDDIYGALPFLKIAWNLPEGAVQQLKASSQKSHVILLVPALTYPASTGKVLLDGSDPFGPPKIFTNHLGDEDDVQTLLDGIRLCQNLTRTAAFSAQAPEPLFVSLPQCERFEPDGDEYWKCLVRNFATTTHHLVGTCKMGSERDPDAVVDSRLRVHGTQGLRVVDASVMPRIISCNVNAAVTMIGEKGAAMIREDWERETHEEL
ncbi:hypothetical protein PPYR_03520 [Photinus pyralis]|uniref:Glucose-methanol-choline oxidoreductase N-terminal domain-containing protein n=2 Tax=Photinus pyralis TaxID=7054 RepID=A0A5N4A317_PHOPY|nr:glucose dehydrogenase [FAD, quinone]-like [Photinus pyralis]KAB0791720.1 hypothetical protein PPYR_03520 [Photinus pyralis]